MSRRKSSRTYISDDWLGWLWHLVSGVWDTLRPYQQELAGLLFFLFALIALLNVFGLAAGSVGAALGNLTQSLFGWGTIPILLALAGLGLHLMRGFLEEEPRPISLEAIIGAELAFLAALVVIHLVAGGNDPLALARAQGGGGFIGWSFGLLLSDLVGRWLAAFIFLAIGLAGLGLIFRLQMGEIAMSGMAITQAGLAPPPEFEAMSEEPPRSRPAAPPSPAKPVRSGPTPTTNKAATTRTLTPSGGKIALPTLDLLSPPALAADRSANARYQAQIIEETLHGFGVPAEVVEINPGPTVTQFGVKPGSISRRMSDGTMVEQRVRVRKISSLVNDLALALAAAPIRIETPVPGRPIVGIEVPNGKPTLVSLREAMESDVYRRSKGQLKASLGRGASGAVAVADLTALPHLLIAGATGSGKSVCINAITVNLLMAHPPQDLKLLMIDPKMVELTAYNGIPHLIAPVVTDFEQVAGALAWVTREMDRRYKAFAAAGARSIDSYNRKVGANERLPFLIVIIDELADLMMLAADEVERYICRIAQMARATGIHMIIATQRPSTDVVTGLIKANFPARIAFAVASQIDSRVILDSPGAESLLGKGDMLFMAPDSPKLVRLQGCFVSEPEINNVVTFWKRSPAAQIEQPVSDTTESVAEPEAERVPWADILKKANQDDMLEDAIKLVIESGRASTTFLQRRLGIGYPRASRVMDQLEEEGIIGPADGTNPRKVLWEVDEREGGGSDAAEV